MKSHSIYKKWRLDCFKDGKQEILFLNLKETAINTAKESFIPKGYKVFLLKRVDNTLKYDVVERLS